MTLALFDQEPRLLLAPEAWLLRGFADNDGVNVLDALRGVLTVAPLRNMLTPGGQRMSVAMTNCGALGWVSDRGGYRYVHADPVGGRPWPVMPTVFFSLAQRAAQAAGFSQFVPDACLINRYHSGDQLSLHQDKDERDFSQPIVSVSLGISAVFLLGGPARKDRPRRLTLTHGDTVVWGGQSRLNYHGIAPIAPACHPLTGEYRFNLTFRQAG